MKKLYFGHPVNTYGSLLEDSLIQAIQPSFPEWQIENPNTKKHRESYAAHKAKTGNGMTYFTEQVLPCCSGGVFLLFRDGAWGAGVFSEAQTLFKAGHPIWRISADGEITALPRLEGVLPLSIQETRKRVYDETGAIKPY